ncbi:MAG: N-acetylneuraminate synthase family protein [Candidatus Thorarchaeota archaeon]
MIKPVIIKNKYIGESYPTFIIAEMACAHQGEVENACKMVDVAVKAKADAIQLQLFRKEVYMSPLYKDYELISSLELSFEEWEKVITKIKKTDILFFAAGYDIDSINFLIEKDVDAFKVHSSDTSNPEVLKEVAKSQKPIFLSCGASKIEEIYNAIKFLKKHGTKNVILMHGYQGFPTKIEDINLNFIKTLTKLMGMNVGFYDHVDGGSILAKIIPIMAIGYGTQVIEKHFILSREEKGIDYESSLNPDDFIEFCSNLRICEKAIGEKTIRDFTEGELNYRAYCKKSIVAKVDIKKGTKLSRDDVLFLRNEPGIPPDQFSEIDGKIVKNNIKKFNNINYSDL